MPCANTLGETPIPPLLTSAEVLRVNAALIRLVALAVLLAVLHLFGFRFRRDRCRPTAKPAQKNPTPITTDGSRPPARPRRVWCYLDRTAFLAEFNRIGAEMSIMAPAPAAPPDLALPPPVEVIAPKPRPRPAPAPVVRAPLRPATPTRPPPRSKTRIGAPIFARPFCSVLAMI